MKMRKGVPQYELPQMQNCQIEAQAERIAIFVPAHPEPPDMRQVWWIVDRVWGIHSIIR